MSDNNDKSKLRKCQHCYKQLPKPELVNCSNKTYACEPCHTKTWWIDNLAVPVGSLLFVVLLIIFLAWKDSKQHKDENNE